MAYQVIEECPGEARSETTEQRCGGCFELKEVVCAACCEVECQLFGWPGDGVTLCNVMGVAGDFTALGVKAGGALEERGRADWAIGLGAYEPQGARGAVECVGSGQGWVRSEGGEVVQEGFGQEEQWCGLLGADGGAKKEFAEER